VLPPVSDSCRPPGETAMCSMPSSAMPSRSGPPRTRPDAKPRSWRWDLIPPYVKMFELLRTADDAFRDNTCRNDPSPLVEMAASGEVVRHFAVCGNGEQESV
jgi:hypothetical protein